MSRKRQRKNEEEEDPDDDSKDNTATTTSSSSTADKGGSKASSSSSSDSITAFIRNTFNLVSDPSTDHIVRWSEDGLSFLVLDEFAFSKQLLPIYFRHRNFSSFVRQLNFYNFCKRQQDGRHTRLSHPCFRRGRIDLLHHIRRKSAHDGGAGSVKLAVSSLSQQVRELRGQYDDLFKIQQQILYIFSRYMRAHAGGEAGRGIRAVLGGTRERLMLSGAGGDAAAVSGRRAVSGGAHLSPIERDDAEDARFLHPHPNVELLEDGDDDGVNIQEMKEEEEAGQLDDDDAHGDDGEELGDGDLEEDEEQKAHNEATAQAFAELRSLQEMMNQLPSKQSFLSSIPAVTLPTASPFRRGGSAAPASSAAASTSSSAAAAAGGAAPLLHDYANVFEPPSPSATKTAYNAFADNSAPVALPPLYPGDQHAPVQPAPAASSSWSSAAPPSTTSSSSSASSSSSSSSTPLSARRKANPKLLYSQEHYAAMEGREGGGEQQPQQQRQRQPKREQGTKVESSTSSSSSSSLPFKLDEHPPPSPSSAPVYSPPSPMPLSSFPPSAFPAGDGYSPQRPPALSQPSSSFTSYLSPPLTPVSGNGWLTSAPSAAASSSSSSSSTAAVPGSAGADDYADIYGDAGTWANGAGVGMLPHLRADSLDSTDSTGRIPADKAASAAHSLYFSHY